MPNERVDYGIDAPGVVRSLVVVGIAGLSLWAMAVFLVSSGRITIPKPYRGFVGMAFGTGLGCLAMAGWMVWESRVGKLRTRDQLLNKISWTGSEQVLDVGCGRGLMLIGAAKRLTTGRATGIDIWQAEDLSGNDFRATLENAQREGVLDRIWVETA